MRPQTLDQYRANLCRTILPLLGALRLREATVSRIDQFLTTLAATRPASARAARTILGQMMSLAVRHDALATNPVRYVARQRKPLPHRSIALVAAGLAAAAGVG